MPSPPKYHVDFVEGKLYHVFNRTNNKELLFRSDENHRFFIRRFGEYLSPLVDTFAWCLLPNHFHFLIRVKGVSDIASIFKSMEKRTIAEDKFLRHKISISEIVELGFKRFFQSYVLAYNKMYNRNGNLFYKTFRRTLVDQDQYFTQVVLYIHSNPIKHGLVKTYALHQWSSWHAFESNQRTRVSREEVLAWFGGIDAFRLAHELALKGLQPFKGWRP